jgi:hypothetical protein
MRFLEQFGVFLIFGLVLLAGPLLGSFMTSVIDFFLQAFTAIFRV